VGFFWGYLSYQHQLFPYGMKTSIQELFQDYPDLQKTTGGLWQPSRRVRSASERENKQQRDLSALGYLSGYELPPTERGVLIHDPNLAYSGYNFYTSGHAPEAILMDMQGKQLYKWSYKERSHEREIRYWFRRAYLYPDGAVLAILDRDFLVKLDKDSELIWSYGEDFSDEGGCHHDLEVNKDGSIYVLTREKKSYPEIDESQPIWDEFVTILDSNGNLTRKVSILKAFANSSYASLLDRRLQSTNGNPADILHSNTVEILDGRLSHQSAVFKEGNVLISAKNLDTIAVLDMNLERVMWALTGMWTMQHQPTVLENRNLLLFDNTGHFGFSKVIEFNPFTQTVVWAYGGDQNNQFFSDVMGSNLRLPNGNTLITESTAGRAFEVTQELEIVWEFINPERAGENEELIAVLPEMLRLETDFSAHWMK
jgi:hypothetical protein